MSAILTDHDGNRRGNTLRAGRLPAGKKLFDAAGVSSGKESLLRYARGLHFCPPQIEAVRADTVDLEWISPEGETQPWGATYRKKMWVILEPIAQQAS